MNNAETLIRGKYPQLQQEPLKYSVMIGGLHTIEHYTPLVPAIVNLVPPLNKLNISDCVGNIITSKKSFDEVRPLLLAYGVRKVSTKKKIRIPDQQILAMDESTLEKTLREMIK